MAKDLAIVLNSGSLNSAVATSLAAQKYRLVIVHADTTGGPSGRTRAAYEQQVSYFKPYREHTVPMIYPSVTSIVGDSPTATGLDPRQSFSLAPQLLNLLPLIAGAARFAAHYQAAAIYMGLRFGTSSDDLAAVTEYTQIWNELFQMACNQADLELTTPLLELEPWQVVEVGHQVSAPFDRTWSCMEENPEPCWSCRTCRAREAAFQQAAKPDPLRVMRKV